MAKKHPHKVPVYDTARIHPSRFGEAPTVMALCERQSISALDSISLPVSAFWHCVLALPWLMGSDIEVRRTWDFLGPLHEPTCNLYIDVIQAPMIV